MKEQNICTNLGKMPVQALLQALLQVVQVEVHHPHLVNQIVLPLHQNHHLKKASLKIKEI